MYSFNQRYRPPQWFGMPMLCFFALIGLFMIFVFCIYLVVILHWMGVPFLVFIWFPIKLYKYGRDNNDIHFLRHAMTVGRQDQITSTHGIKE